jgi:uncharacterized RDD family membrane protein YckC
MVGDSVREELSTKISPINAFSKPMVSEKLHPELVSIHAISKSIQTSEIMIKNTSPTLVDFQNKNAALPDWRLQLQNSVRRRIDNQKVGDPESVSAQSNNAGLLSFATNGATALKIEPTAEIEPIVLNPILENALKRITNSREKHMVADAPAQASSQTTVKQFPVTFQTKSQEFNASQSGANSISTVPRKNIVNFSSDFKTEKFDTNKLPPLPIPARISSSFDKRAVEPRKIEMSEDEILDSVLDSVGMNSIHKTKDAEFISHGEIDAMERRVETEEFDDFAPIPLRFNAALFDLLIGSFLSLVMLSPFMLLNGRFFSLEGFFAFIATCSIVMFIYLTTTIGFLGRTFGMKLFSLEIIDVEENDYPSLHQAAVSSSVYLLSLALGGIGFLPMLVNSEKRAAHDLLSRTIVVKEY